VEDDAEITADQKKRFGSAIAALAERRKQIEWIHASNSGGLLLEQTDSCNVVRAGLLVYGVVPDGKRLGPIPVGLTFRPALSWKCRVSLVRTMPGGRPIGYGRTFITPGPMRLATITAGYGDGYFRAASNNGQVLAGGARCRIVGRISMDQMVIDVSGVEGIEVGDEVVLIGWQGDESISAGEVAQWCGTIPWEILTNITYRVPRVYRGSHAA
jgi:alanine racemase